MKLITTLFLASSLCLFAATGPGGGGTGSGDFKKDGTVAMTGNLNGGGHSAFNFSSFQTSTNYYGMFGFYDPSNSTISVVQFTNVTQNVTNIYSTPWPAAPGWCYQIARTNNFIIFWTNGPCGSGGGGSVAGADKDVQFNDGGVQGADAGVFQYSKALSALFVGTSEIRYDGVFIGGNYTAQGPTSSRFQTVYDNIAGFYPVMIDATTGDSITARYSALNVTHISAKTNTPPTISAGAGAGTSPTVGLQGGDASGIITITSGTLPSVSSTIVTVTFGTAYHGKTAVVLWPHNGPASLLNFLPYTSGESNAFTISASTTALIGSTTYEYNYHVISIGE